MNSKNETCISLLIMLKKVLLMTSLSARMTFAMNYTMDECWCHCHRIEAVGGHFECL